MKVRKLASLTEIINSEDFLSCCNNFYTNPIVKYFLGDYFHPGGKKLTLEISERLGINSSSKVLDVASGEGTTALLLASKYNCEVIGIEMNSKLVDIAKKKSIKKGLSDSVTFIEGIVGSLKLDPNQFDHIICECSFCLFDDKELIMKDFYRILKDGGNIGISDIIVHNKLPTSMEKTIFQVMCLYRALNAEKYESYMLRAGFKNLQTIEKKHVLEDLLHTVRKKYIGLKILSGVKSEINGFSISKIDLENIQMAISYLKEFLENEYGTYKLFIGTKDHR